MTASALTVRERPLLMSGPMVRATLDGRKTQTRRVVTAENSSFGSAPPAFWPHADFTRAVVDGKGSGSEYLHVPAHVAPDCAVCREWGWADTSHRLYPRMAPARCWDRTATADYTPPASRLWVRESFRYHHESGWDTSGGEDVLIDQEHVRYAENLRVGMRRDNERGEIVERVTYLHESTPIESDEGLKRYRGRPSIHMPRWASRISLEITNIRVERVQDISEDDAIAEGVGGLVDLVCAEYQRQLDRGLFPSTPQGDARGDFRFLWDSLNESRGYGWDVNPYVWVIEYRRVTP